MNADVEKAVERMRENFAVGTEDYLAITKALRDQEAENAELRKIKEERWAVVATRNAAVMRAEKAEALLRFLSVALDRTWTSPTSKPSPPTLEASTTDLISELAEVVRIASKATPGPWLYRAKSNSWHKPPPEGSPYSYGGYIFGMGDDEEDGNGWDEQFLVAAVQFMRAHHAEIEAMARDAARYRWLRERVDWKPLPEDSAGKVYLVATMVSAVYGNTDDQTDAAIDAAMHDSARAKP